MEAKLYRIIEVADILGVSKVTIYKKIELLKPEIVSFIKTEEGITYVSDAGVKLIKDSIKRRKTRKSKDRASLKVVDLNCEVQELTSNINSKNEEIEKIKKHQKEDLLLNYKYLNMLVNGKRNELKALEESSSTIRKAIERANDLIKMLK